ncbi:MAG: nascent polypeptide-associated complex protein [Candidatus Lokiarchaeota archaeon]|nr:nascent polypeptide-associated complex protein [Candidatus Lokiarchaeota archaeon]
MGFRGMSPKQLARMMKKMGIEQKDISGVTEVIIRFEDKEWLISKPQVALVKQAGSESFQISGEKTERGLTTDGVSDDAAPIKKEVEIPKEDAALVASQTNVSIEEATEALKETEGDLAAAILKLRHK